MGETLSFLIDRLDSARVIVAGDAMLDLYTSGPSTRPMPEADHAPVILIEESGAFLGGAANVAANIRTLGGLCDFICLTGHDSNRPIMLDLAAQHGLSHEGFIADNTRPTITKERIIANGRHIARLDRERTHDIASREKEAMLAYYNDKIDGAGAVVLSDYCKGTLSDDVIRSMIKTAQGRNIPVLLDSKRRDLSVFRGALLAKPNMKELAERTEPFDIHDEADIAKASRGMMTKSGIENLIASRSELGMMLVTAHDAQSFPATARHVREVSGAGDTALSACALAIAAGADIGTAACLANIAAGAAVEKDTTAAIDRDELRQAVERYHRERKRA